MPLFVCLSLSPFCSWWPSLLWSPQQLRSHCHVLLLHDVSHGTPLPKVPVVETAPENASNDPIYGPADSVYEGLKYKLRLEFPAGYPYSAPTVRFVTPFDNSGKALNF